MRVLIVEDDQYKLNNICEFISNKFPEYIVDFAKSVSSSIKSVTNCNYVIIILDMSLPTFDVTITESGGKPQGFGGLDILRYLESIDSVASVIVVTQFEKFGEGIDEKDLSVLRRELINDFPGLLKGVVYFDASGNNWQSELCLLLGAE